ncbi:glycosyltransferase family 2 protein [Pseudoflavonifractor phocaeensis]|uniref:glycosyltransferase family 2 protein n=1 Tax=Pseudoflavonifractor phocaeensis TaxID=1870988 RepID=UPI00195A7F26|nr:glycosyltransferase family 2 protein [Pseudoflavonifractor phocaeensis]MBM6937446.1 glycosyltransferase family 2 protein [Pseudoflavonifractor phocaeensis]
MKISVIVPVYNAEQYLPQCLDSLLQQTYQDLEIICVDDGSTDASGEVLRRYTEKDRRVSAFFQRNMGVSQARNLALRHATGEYLMFVDGDDWLELNTCQSAVEAMERTRADVVMWTYIREYGSHRQVKHIFDEEELLFDGEGCRELHRRMIGLVGRELAHPETADALCTLWGKLYRRSIIADHDIRVPDIRYFGTYEDGLFNLNAFAFVQKAVFLNRPFYHYRRDNSASITQSFKKDLFQKQQVLFDYMSDYIKSHPELPDGQEALSNRIALSLISLGLNELENPSGMRARYAGINAILTDPRCHSAYGTLPLGIFPIHWKAFFWFAQRRFTFGVYLLCWCINFLRK